MQSLPVCTVRHVNVVFSFRNALLYKNHTSLCVPLYCPDLCRRNMVSVETIAILFTGYSHYKACFKIVCNCFKISSIIF